MIASCVAPSHTGTHIKVIRYHVPRPWKSSASSEKTTSSRTSGR